MPTTDSQSPWPLGFTLADANAFYQGTPLPITDPQSPWPLGFTLADANAFYQGASLPTTDPQSPWPLGYTPADANPRAEVSPATVSGPMITEQVRQEVHEVDIKLSQVPGYQYTSEGKLQTR